MTFYDEYDGEVCVAPDLPFGGDNSIIDQDFYSFF